MCDKCNAVYKTKEEVKKCELRHLGVLAAIPVYAEHAQVPHELAILLEGNHPMRFKYESPMEMVDFMEIKQRITGWENPQLKNINTEKELEG